MATQPYRQTTGLNDLLMAQAQGGPSPMVQPGATSAPEGIDPSLYDQAFAPEDLGPRPEVGNKHKGLATFLLGLGDALNSSASILGRTDVRTHNLQSYMDYLEGQKQSQQQFDRLTAKQKSESERSKARFLLGKQEQAQIRADEAAGQKILEKAAAAKADEKRQQELADVAQEQAFQLEKQAKAQAFDQSVQKARFAHEQGMAKLEGRLKGGDQGAEKDLKNFSTGAQIVAGFENGLPAGKDGSPAVPPLSERVKAGEDPDDIRRNFEDELDQAGIFGAPRDLIRNRFNERMLRLNRRLELEAEQQPPPGQ